MSAAVPPSDAFPTSLIKRPQPYGWAWGIGLGLHLALLVAALVVAFWPSAPRIDSSQTPLVAKLVRLGKPRDPKMLPRKESGAVPPPAAAKPLPVAPARAPVSPAAAPAPAAAPSKAPPDPRARLDDVMKRFKATAIAGQPEEDVGMADGDPDGDAEQAEEGERYFALVKKKIQEHYTVPATISDQERVSLRAVVRIYIQRNGEIARAQVVEPSGNATFDGALETAVGKVRILPPPPAHLTSSLASEGIDLRFTASGR